MLKLKWYGTAAVSLSCDGGRILFDPFVPLHGSDVTTTLPDYDGYTDIIITHGHFDHTASLPQIVERNPQVRIHCTGAPYHALRKKGVQPENLVRIYPGQTYNINGFHIETYPGRHAVLPEATPGRLKSILTDRNVSNVPGILREVIRCRENGETLLYLIEAGGKRITLMGSMNLRDGVKYPSGSDILILPYNGWEDNYPPAVRVIEALKPEKVYLDHYDNTFPPVTSPLDLSPVISRYGNRVIPLTYSEICIE